MKCILLTPVSQRTRLAVYASGPVEEEELAQLARLVAMMRRNIRRAENARRKQVRRKRA